MPTCRFLLSVRVFALLLACLSTVSTVVAQGARHTVPEASRPDSDADDVKERAEWFLRGRLVHGKSAAELRRRAYQAKLQMRAQHAAALAAAPRANGKPPVLSGSWTPLGPVPLASDATGNGTQDYHQVAGRATAVVIDAADPTGNTVYIGGAQSGVWKSTNAANSTASGVTWTPLTDDQATLSIGALAIQPGNSDPAKSVILAATGEADNSGDSYFGLGILRSTDAGSTWSLISSANNGTLSFSGLGGTRMAFSTASGQTSTVVSAMATTSEGLIDGAVTANTARGLYTSMDAGQTWTYDALVDPGGATDATSAMSVAYNAKAGLFFAAVRYHGFYSSPDGTHWTRLSTQPGGALLNTTACPPQSTSNNRACPIYRAEITVVPGRNEMYAWFVYFSSGSIVDGGIWQSVNGGASWTPMSNTAITNCGDSEGCGAQQGAYNLELLAVPNVLGTDLYAGAVNLFKCAINSQNVACANAPFMNLTHVYGCDPISAPAHVHPDQHALAYVIPSSGSDSGNALMYFANDGGIYRTLDGFGGLNTGSCSGTNQFDDLNQNLGSMAQFVSFSQHPSDPNTLLGGTQDNGSPATNQATTKPGWVNVLGGDGGYNAIDPSAPSNFYAANPDVPPGGLGIQLCSSGVNCIDSSFGFVVTSSTVGGDDGGFYFPYILDPQSTSALLVGTCRVWRGPRTGGSYISLSPNFDSLGAGTCSGSEVNQVRALAAGGPTDSNGSQVVYATTSGLGPLDGPVSAPVGGHVWVTTNATAGISSFAEVTGNGPQGSINPKQFPISSVAVDPSDPTGSTAYVTVMGFTGGAGHVWKTSNAGGNWSDFTANLPDSPVNAVVVDPTFPQIYVGTDVGVFTSSTAAASWTELGPNPNANQAGFLPDVAVTALALFNSGGQELLRASTYGRGIWQFNLITTPDFQLSVSNSPLTVFEGETSALSGAANALNGYASAVTLTCAAGATSLPRTCAPSPSTLTPAAETPFLVTVGGVIGDYGFSVKGTDANNLSHSVPVTVHIVSFALTTPSPTSVTVPRGSTSSPVSFQATAAGSFNQSVTVSCGVSIANATCTLTPGTTVNPTSTNPITMTASVAVPAGTAAGSYPVTIQATTAGAPATLTTSFTLKVTSNPDFVLTEPSAFPEVNAGSTGTTGPIAIASQDGFNGTVSLSCPSTFGANSCSISPASVNSFPATATLTVNGTSFAVGSYTLSITGTSGSVVHSVTVPFNVGDYSISGTQNLSLAPGGQGTANLTLTSSTFYSGKVNATCDASALSGAICTLSPVNPIAVTSGGTANLTAAISVPNDATSGTYNIKIGTQDTTGAPTHTFTVALTIGEDFLLTSSTQSQTVHAGQTTGPYNLTIRPVGASFNAAVTLACSGLPLYTLCSFNPSAPVTPGSSAASVVMSISTTATTSDSHRPVTPGSFFYLVWLPMAGIAIGWGAVGYRPRKGRSATWVWLALMLGLILILMSCGGVSSGGGGGGGHPGTPPGTYKITVTGTSPGAPSDAGQTVQVTLIVN